MPRGEPNAKSRYNARHNQSWRRYIHTFLSRLSDVRSAQASERGCALCVYGGVSEGESSCELCGDHPVQTWAWVGGGG